MATSPQVERSDGGNGNKRPAPQDIVPCNGVGQHAADVSGQLAQLTKYQVVAAHVHELAVGRWGSMRLDDTTGDAFAEAIVKGLLGAGIDARLETRDAHYGQVAQALSAAADDLDADMIVVGSRGRSNVASLTLGSVSHKLLHLARRPMLVVPSA